MIINPYIFGGFDADALLFITNAGITDTTQKNSINKLVVDFKTYGIWSEMIAIYPFIGGTASTHRFNLKAPTTNASDFYGTFVGGGTHSATGYLPNGTSGYMDTNITPATHLDAYDHVTYYSRTDSTNTHMIGVQDDVTGVGAQIYLQANKTQDYYSLANNDTNVIKVNNTSTLGMYGVSRSSTTSLRAYRNGSFVGNNFSVSLLKKPNMKMYLGATNYKNSGGATTILYGNKEMAFVSVGNTLNDTQMANMYTAVQAFQIANGRNV